MEDENLVDKAVRQIDAWLKATGVSESRLGMLACANARAVERVRNGTAQVESLRLIMDHIKANPVPKTKK